MNVAKMKYEIDSSQAKTAKTNLGGMSKAAKDAENAQKGLGTTSTRAGRQVAAANDNMSKSAGFVTKAYSAMRVAMLAAIVGVTAGLVGLTRLMGKFTSSSVEAQKQQAQLAAAIRSTGGAAGQTLSSLNAHAAALQKVTNFGDEATNAAQGVLLTFTKIRGDVFPRATEAVQDLAQALGTGLQSAAIQVGKALNDPVVGMTAMSRSGITFTEAQKEMVKSMVASGDMIGAQTLILKELETQFGGSARAARETLGGALTALGNAWGDLFELSSGATNNLRLSLEALVVAISDPAFAAFMSAIGTVLLGALQAATMAATALANGIIFLVENIDTIGVAAGTAGATLMLAFGPQVFSAIVAGFNAMAVAGVRAMAMITTAIASNPIALLVIGITTVVTALYAFRDEIEQVIGVDVVGVAKTAANLMIASFVVAYENIKFLWSGLGMVIAAGVIGGVNLAIDAINGLIDGAKQGINSLIEMVNQIPGVDVGALATGTDTIDQVENTAAAGLQGLLGQRSSAIDAAMSTDYIGRLGEMFQTSASNANEFQAAVAGANAELDQTGAAGTAAAEGLKKTKEKSDQLKDSMDFTKDAIKGALSTIRTDLINGELSWKSFGNAALGILDKIIGKIEDQLATALTDAMFSMNSAGSGGGGWLGGIFGGIGKLFGIPGLAGGTNYAKGGTTMVGEEGPELVNMPRGATVHPAGETARMMRSANSNQQQSVKVSSDVRVFVDEDGNWQAAVRQISNEQVASAAPGIVEQANSLVLPTVADQQANRSGSDYRISS